MDNFDKYVPPEAGEEAKKELPQRYEEVTKAGGTMMQILNDVQDLCEGDDLSVTIGEYTFFQGAFLQVENKKGNAMNVYHEEERLVMTIDSEEVAYYKLPSGGKKAESKNAEAMFDQVDRFAKIVSEEMDEKKKGEKGKITTFESEADL